MRKRVLPILLTLVVWFIMFYTALPAINIQSREFWTFAMTAIVVAVVINMWSIVKNISLVRGDPKNRELFKKFKFAILVIVALIIVYIGGDILSSPILRASSYRELIQPKNSEFSDDIKEVDYSQIPILDRDSAAILAEREMGSMVDMVSQYEVSNYYNQINYQQKPVRVTPLQYGNEIKWLTNRKTGIPAYMRIDMTTQDVELVRLEEGIKISPSEYFSRDLMRYLRFRYPTLMFAGMKFEIDDAGVPYWIAQVETHRIGLFGGVDIKGIVALNAVTGENIYYDVKDVPQWIDNVYNADILIQQYDYYGKLVNGYINSIFGQKGCLQTTEGYNYIAFEDDVWVYTGVTSVTSDQSNVGFILINQRTKETRYYPISGAKEISAMSSAEGQVQHLGYRATFPLLLNIAGEPTYFLALKDSSGLVKKYAMVNIEKYQLVATGDSVSECEKVYRSLMSNSGVGSVDTSKVKTVTGTIKIMKDVVVDGNSIYYVMIENSEDLFEVTVKDHLNILKKNVGDRIDIEYIPSVIKGVHDVNSIK